MAWKETCVVKERMKFILDYYGDEPPNMAELCRQYGVSRKTAYKWIKRYADEGPSGLEGRSRRPHSNARQTPDWMEEAIVNARKNRPHWGPKKLRAVFVKQNPGVEFPSLTTFANIISRNGLLRPKRRRKPSITPFEGPFVGCEAPNDVWCADFKGDFQTGRSRCYPLTITDAFTRYIIRCESLKHPRHREVNRVFESAFSEFGLPRAIRTDNGPPFASTSVGGLSNLSVWWMRLGIQVARIVLFCRIRFCKQ